MGNSTGVYMLTAKLLEVFTQHTYTVLFCWVCCEQIGVPIPSAPVLVTAGALCSASCGRWACTLATVIVACLLADSLWYQLGRRYGRVLLSFLMKVSLLSPASLLKASDKLAKYNGMTLLFAKFIPGVSTLAPPLSGHSGMTRSRFLFWDLLGSLVWAVFWLLSGGLLLQTLRASGHLLQAKAGVALTVVSGLVAALIIWKMATYLKLVLEIRRVTITPQTLQQMLSAREGNAEPCPYVVDLRIPQDVLREPRQIPHAVRINPQSLRRERHLIPKDREIVFYCSCPSEATSTLWALRLRKSGINKARLLRGGLDGWRKAGYVLQATVAK